jgi:hypothetical protein
VQVIENVPAVLKVLDTEPDDVFVMFDGAPLPANTTLCVIPENTQVTDPPRVIVTELGSNDVPATEIVLPPDPPGLLFPPFEPDGDVGEPSPPPPQAAATTAIARAQMAAVCRP